MKDWNVTELGLWNRCPWLTLVPAEYEVRKGRVSALLLNTEFDQEVLVIRHPKHNVHIAVALTEDLVGEAFNKIVTPALQSLEAQVLELEFPSQLSTFVAMKRRSNELQAGRGEGVKLIPAEENALLAEKYWKERSIQS